MRLETSEIMNDLSSTGHFDYSQVELAFRGNYVPDASKMWDPAFQGKVALKLIHKTIQNKSIEENNGRIIVFTRFKPVFGGSHSDCTGIVYKPYNFEIDTSGKGAIKSLVRTSKELGQMLESPDCLEALPNYLDALANTPRKGIRK